MENIVRVSKMDSGFILDVNVLEGMTRPINVVHPAAKYLWGRDYLLYAARGKAVEAGGSIELRDC